MKDEHLLRYGKQMLVPGFGLKAQEKLLAAEVLIVGVGGLGCPAALYLARAGIGKLTLADNDTVELDNLYRQILYTDDSIGQSKTQAAAQTLSAQNRAVHIDTLNKRMDETNLGKYVERADVVLDASDNYETREAINRCCFIRRKPLISAAAIRAEGQLAVFDFRDGNGPCYTCLYPRAQQESQDCANQGVIGTVVGMMGVFQALETIKLLTDYGRTNIGKLMILDGANGDWRTFSLNRDEACAVCSTG
jgi:molybdopterin/thiamine biosynthesis adenylyltransferase